MQRALCVRTIIESPVDLDPFPDRYVMGLVSEYLMAFEPHIDGAPADHWRGFQYPNLADPAWSSNPSRSAVSDGHLAIFDNHGHFTLAVGQFEHGVQVGGILFNVKIGVGFVGLPGPIGIGSPRLAIDQNIRCHCASPFYCSPRAKYLLPPSQFGS